MFYNTFFALLSRPAISHDIEHSTGRLSVGSEQILSNWRSIRERISALLQTANPESIGACDLRLALLQPQLAESSATIARYTTAFASKIEARIAPVRALIESVDHEVNWLLGSATHLVDSGHRRHSPLLDLCGALGRELTALKGLESLGREP